MNNYSLQVLEARLALLKDKLSVTTSNSLKEVFQKQMQDLIDTIEFIKEYKC